MFPEFSHWIWPIIGAMLLFVGFYPPEKILSRLKKKKCEVPIEAIKFNNLHSRFRHCQTVLEYSHPTKQAEIKNTLPFLKELDISHPSWEYATIPMWKDFFDQLIRLTETEDESVMNRNLEKARQVYSSDELEKWHKG